MGRTFAGSESPWEVKNFPKIHGKTAGISEFIQGELWEDLFPIKAGL